MKYEYVWGKPYNLGIAIVYPEHSAINQYNISQSYYIYTHIIINCSFKSAHVQYDCYFLSFSVENYTYFVDDFS